MDSRILVIYAGRYGSTAEVAEAIGQELSRRGARVDVRPATDVPDVASYDAVIIGSAIYYGRWFPEAIRIVKTHREVLSRTPVAYFLTCMELTKIFEEKGPSAPIYYDPLLGKPPQVEGRLSLFERTHLLSEFLDPVLREAAEVKPVSIGAFRGKLDYARLNPIDRLLMKLIWLFFKRAPEGDFRNWEAISSWSASLCPLLLQQG